MPEYTCQITTMGNSHDAKDHAALDVDSRARQIKANSTSGKATSRNTRLFMVVAMSNASATPNPNQL